MAMRELRLEQLLGKCVFDSQGDRVGRIEEVRVEQQGDEWIILEYFVGIAAVFERLSAWSIETGLLHLLGARKTRKSYRVPWDKLDLSDPLHPRLTCTLEQLKEITQALEAELS